MPLTHWQLRWTPAPSPRHAPYVWCAVRSVFHINDLILSRGSTRCSHFPMLSCYSAKRDKQRRSSSCCQKVVIIFSIEHRICGQWSPAFARSFHLPSSVIVMEYDRDIQYSRTCYINQVYPVGAVSSRHRIRKRLSGPFSPASKRSGVKWLWAPKLLILKKYPLIALCDHWCLFMQLLFGLETAVWKQKWKKKRNHL